eukprot:12842513-Alexandrium_andersonii.AAC.1
MSARGGPPPRGAARARSAGARWGAKQVSYPGLTREAAPNSGAGPLGAAEASQRRALARPGR